MFIDPRLLILDFSVVPSSVVRRGVPVQLEMEKAFPH
jgi:hypothetical protein